MFAGTYFAGAAFAGLTGLLPVPPLPPPITDAGIVIGGVPVTARVRLAGVTIRDILNDAPNTATFTIEGDAPAVGQTVRITMGARVLFAGAVQTVDQVFEGQPIYLAWRVTAIDDTARANARRPFGTWVDTPADAIANYLTVGFTPGFSAAGIQGGLPPVTITFDGSDTLIGALARLATAIGGYTKIEDRTVFLFLEDTTDPPAPIDDAHPFLFAPPITINTDASQLRTRVYGKGYGESVPTDINAGETLIPIQDGVMFPPLGGLAIAGLTADGAQSEKIAFTGVVLGSGGSLVGPGAAPSSPPLLELAGGTGVTPGLHTLSVVYVSAQGRSLAGPPASITTGTLPAPATAPTADVATPGTGPDQGAHDYAVSFVTSYGETVPGPISNAIATSAALGQLPAPGQPTADDTMPTPGNLTCSPDPFNPIVYRYRITYGNAQGETTGGPIAEITAMINPTPRYGTPGFSGLNFNSFTSGGGLTPGTTYLYRCAGVTASGFESEWWQYLSVQMGGNNAVTLTVFGFRANQGDLDTRIVKRRIYRTTQNGTKPHASGNGGYFIAEISGNTDTTYTDTMSDATAETREAVFDPGFGTPSLPRGTSPGWQCFLSNISVGPAGVTSRRIYRYRSSAGTDGLYHQIGTLNNNTATLFTDNTPDGSEGALLSNSNTTGTATQRIPVSNIPIGPAGVTARKLYRRFNGAGPFKLVTTLANNTATTYADAVANAALGATALATATAIGGQIKATIPIGPPGALYREFFMSPVGDPVRRQVGGITDNVTTTITFSTSDSVILTGFTEPTSDTSGLQQPSGQVNPGATSLLVAFSGPFRPSGGWVTLSGRQVIKHTGISGNTLTGIPATGSGSITTAVIYGSQALPSPMLTGVSGLTKMMRAGSAVHIWVQRDDLAAQAEHAARTGGDGIVEYLIVDARRGVDSLTARCDADLAQFSRPLLTIAYATRDVLTKSGKDVLVNLPSQRIGPTTLTIQEVTITELGLAPGLAPRYTVRASNVRFSLEDTLRRLIAGGPIIAGTN